MQLRGAPSVYLLEFTAKELAILTKGLAMVAGVDGVVTRSLEEANLAAEINAAILKQQHALAVQELKLIESKIKKIEGGD